MRLASFNFCRALVVKTDVSCFPWSGELLSQCSLVLKFFHRFSLPATSMIQLFSVPSLWEDAQTECAGRPLPEVVGQW
jgi:hypothetical protein